MGGLFTAWMIDYTKSLGRNPATSELTVDYEPGRVWVRLIAERAAVVSTIRKQQRDHPEDLVPAAAAGEVTTVWKPDIEAG